MISLTLAALRARWAQALALTLLAVCATAAAVSGPAYLTAVDRAVIDHEFAAADPSERGIAVSTVTVPGGTNPDFDRVTAALSSLPGFIPVLSSEVTVANVGGGADVASRTLTYRQDSCAHLVIVAGRCVAGDADLMVSERTAAAQKLVPGTSVVLAYARAVQKSVVVVGVPKRLTIVGVYRVPDPNEPYWGLGNYFSTDSGAPAGPLFTNQATLAGLNHEAQSDTLEAIATPGRLAPDGLAQLRHDLSDLQTRFATAQLHTGLPPLLDRIDGDRKVTGALVPLAGLPLVLLAWFVIFLAVRYATEARRSELGLVALRGARAPRRWWLAVGENLVPILLGGAVGYLVGPYAVGRLARFRLGVPASDPHALRYALVAVFGAIGVVVLAQARELATPAADLLRKVPTRVAAWRGLAGEGIIVLVAGYAAVQLRLSGGRLTGVSLLAPALLVLGIAVLAARAVVPLADRYAIRALGRGRVGLALATMQLSRRPGAQRLFVLMVAAVGLLGFAASAGDVAARARADRAEIGTGAPRTLRLASVDPRQLLAGVRALDPTGRYAMAVAEVPPAIAGQAPVLAVDSTRLGVAAAWRADYTRASAASIGARLHPDAPAPIILDGRGVTLDIDFADATPVAPAPSAASQGESLSLVVVPVGPGSRASVALGTMKPGVHTYRGVLPVCPGGCRLASISVTGGGSTGNPTPITLRELGTTEPNKVAVSGSEFAAGGKWRAVSGSASPTGDNGLALAFHADGQTGTVAAVRPVDTPYPLPVASTSVFGTDAQFGGVDGKAVAVTQTAHVAGLPALGDNGTFVDLEYVERLSSTTDSALAPQVWLGSAAPPDVVEQLSSHGLTVVAERQAAAVLAALDRQGAALALWFHLVAAGFAVALAAGGSSLVAAVDRRRRAEDLSALRIQGLGRPTTDRAGLLTQVLLVLAATVVGLAAAVLVWWSLGGLLPVFVDDWKLWPRPSWPTPPAVLVPWLAAAVVLLGAGFAAAGDLRRAVRGRGRAS